MYRGYKIYSNIITFINERTENDQDDKFYLPYVDTKIHNNVNFYAL